MSDAKVLRVDPYGGTYTAGESAPTEVTVENTGASRHTFFVGYTVHGPNGNSYDNDGGTGTTLTLLSGERKRVTVEWDVEADAPEGSFDVQVAIWEESDRANLQTRLDGSWTYDAFYVQEETIDGRIASVSPNGGTYVSGDRVRTDIEVENTGNVDHTFFVGYSVYDPNGDERDNDGTTGQRIQLSPDEHGNLQLEWEVESSAPEGSYNIRVSIWEENDPDNLRTRLDDLWTYDAFYVQEETADASLDWIDPNGGTYSTGEAVETTVQVENTGNVDHTFFVGYTIHGPDGDEYDNDDSTGQTVTLSPDEHTDLRLDWNVESNIPDGEYDIQVAVWEESVRDNLQTRLDESWSYDAFSVESEEADVGATIDDVAITSGEFTAGETVSGEVNMRNTGDADHTFFVGYSVYGPDGGEYDNGGATGKQITLAAGEQTEIDLGWEVEADVPSGEYDVRVAIWREADRDNLQTLLNKSWSYAAFSVENAAIAIEDVVTTPPDGEVRSFETTPAVTATLRSESDGVTVVTVEYRVRGPNGDLVTSATDELIVGSEDAGQSEFEWPISPEQTLGNGPHDLSITVADETGAELVAETFEEAFVLHIGSLGRVDYVLELYEADGDRPDAAAVTMEPVDGSGSYSRRSAGGTVALSDVPAGEYELTVEHSETGLTESLRVFVGERFTKQRVVFDPAERLRGTVVDGMGDQQIPNATVRLDGGAETTTDGLGMFRFDRRVPDGQHELIVETPDGQIVTETVDLDADRHVSVETDDPFKAADRDSETPDREVIEEANHLVTIVARYVQNTDAEDVVINHYSDQIHGAVKGIIAGFQEIIGTLKETIQTILSLDLEEVIDGIVALLGAIYETRGKILLDMLVAMVADIPDALEAIHEQQEADNPYDEDDPRALSFMSGWYTGYAAINLAAGGAIGRGITTGSRAMLSASDRLSDSLQAGANTIRRADSDDVDTLSPGEMSMFKHTRSTEEPGRGDGYSGRSDVIGGFAVTEVIHNAPHPELLRQVLKSAYLTNHRYRGKWDSDDPTNDYGDPLRSVRSRENLDPDARSNLQGALAERLLASKFLSGEGRFPKVYSVMTEYDPSKVPEGKSGVVLNYDPDRFGGEFDAVQFKMRPRGDGNSPEPVVTDIWESTTNTPEKLMRNKKTTLGKIKSKVRDDGMGYTDTLPATSLPAKAFTRDGDPEIRPVRYREEFGATREQLRETGQYMFENRDSIDHILRPPTEQ